MTLKDAKVGSTVTVRSVGGEGAFRRRIMDMGITKKTQIHIRRLAPLGDPSFPCVRTTQPVWRCSLPDGRPPPLRLLGPVG